MKGFTFFAAAAAVAQNVFADDSGVAGLNAPDTKNTNLKIQQLEQEAYFDPSNHRLTSSLGVPVADNENTLKVGAKGPQLLEDFLMRDKLMFFDRERIPERVVHARAFGAHGVFKAYPGNEKWTSAKVFTNSTHETPVFIRISNVQGFRGSADTVRDVHGFAVKFYTEEGNWDLVGNDIPIFFIQDGIKFFDFVHALKPEPNNEIPQGQTAHDTFWDFMSLNPETTAMSTWIMSDRGISRNLRAINGYGIHTFRWINDKGENYYVKYKWTPVNAGVTQAVWDEDSTLQGKDPDYHRRDMFYAIESGHDYPEWELGVQIFTDEDAEKWDFDHLDGTKMVPEELVPVTPVGKMTINRNTEDYFAETEQVGFSPGNIVPGMDFTDDGMLQTRTYAYADAHLHRLGTVNFNQIPINKPVCPFATNRRGGFAQHQITRGQAGYEPNSVDNGWPRVQPEGGFVSYPANYTGAKIRARSKTYSDHFSQANMYWNSLPPHEQDHMVAAYSFELSKVKREHIRQRVVDVMLQNTNMTLAQRVADNLGLTIDTSKKVEVKKSMVEKSPTLAIINNLPKNIAHNKIAILADDGANGDNAKMVADWAEKHGANVLYLNKDSAPIKTRQNGTLPTGGRRDGEPSVTVDAVVVLDGDRPISDINKDGVTKEYIRSAYRHLKPIVFLGDRAHLVDTLGLHVDQGTFHSETFDKVQDSFYTAIRNHRVWSREQYAEMV